MGLERGSYGAYCFNEAAYYVGTFITHELDQVSGKTETAIRSGRQRVLERYLRDPNAPKKYADPAAMFAQSNGGAVNA